MGLTFDKFKKLAIKCFERDFNDDKSICLDNLMSMKLKKDLDFYCFAQIEFYMALEEEVGFEFKKDIPVFDHDVTFLEFLTFIFKKQMSQTNKRNWVESK